MLTSLMTELAGDDGRAGGALLRQARSTNSAKIKPHFLDQGPDIRHINSFRTQREDRASTEKHSPPFSMRLEFCNGNRTSVILACLKSLPAQS